MIYPETFESKIGFDRIRSLISESCLCELGREKVEQMSFMNDYEIISLNLQITSELKTILEFEENFPQDNYIDGRQSLYKIKVEGTAPDVEDLVKLRKSQFTIIQLAKYLTGRDKAEKYPTLAMLSREVDTYPDIIQSIDRIIDKNGQVKDNASPELGDIRQKIRQTQSEVQRKLQSILKKAKIDGLVEDEAEITFRDGRPVIPVPSSNKRKLGGMMHDESSSGKTAFIEPGAVVELNNRAREHQIAESREIRRILMDFANYLRPFLYDIIESYAYLAEIDFARAKARFAQRIKAVKPIMQNLQSFSWKNAIHPLLYIAHKEENKEVVPLSIHLELENRILVISGPNAGGKSVCLKSVGLLQYMLQCGLLVSMSPNSEAGIFNSIFIDIGDEQSIDNDLSTYSGHLENMKYVVKNADEKTLILIDEFGTGTEPALGGAIAEAVLEKIYDKKSFAVITTHYANLKHYASETQGILNGAMLFDTQSIRPLYQLSIGRPGSSFAIDIARKIGLPEDILKSASDKIGQEHFNYDKQLREISRDKKYWESKRQRIRKVEKTLDELYDKYNSELEEVQKERKKILREAKAEAQQLLKNANAQVEGTIRQIKEAKAEKERTKDLRNKLESYKKELQSDKPGDDKFDKKMKELEKAGKRLAKASPEIEKAKAKRTVKQKPKEIQTGDMVKLEGMESSGEVVKIDGKKVTISFGSMLSTVDINKIIRSENQEKRKPQTSTRLPQSISAKKVLFKPEIDVRGKRGDEAIMEVQQFIDDAVMASSTELTILHGKGNGILRQLIRDYLATINVVKSCKDGHADRGGAGLTIVKLEY